MSYGPYDSEDEPYSEDEGYMYEGYMYEGNRYGQDMPYAEAYPQKYDNVEAAIKKLAKHRKITDEEAENYINMFTNTLLETNALKEGYELHALDLIYQASKLNNKKGGKKSRKSRKSRKSKKQQRKSRKSRKSKKQQRKSRKSRK